jgi:hypothetical protein
MELHRVDALCSAWGRYLRCAPDGYSSMNVLHRIHTEGEGAAIRPDYGPTVPGLGQPKAAVYVARALPLVSRRAQEAVSVYYLLGSTKERLAFTGWSKSCLYRRRQEALRELWLVLGRMGLAV